MEREKELMIAFAGVYKLNYETSKNPMWVWRAIEVLSRAGADHPLWIREYLGKVAGEFCSIYRPGDAFRQEIVNILGLKASSFSEPNDTLRDAYIGLRIWELRKEKRTLEDCFEIVAGEFELSPERIKSIYKKNKMPDNYLGPG